MTPISFALEIILDCVTIEEAHKRARKYIKELEKEQGAAKARALPTHIQQAPSTQRILDNAAQPMAAPPMLAMPQRVIGGEVNNGDGTKGKRKW